MARAKRGLLRQVVARNVRLFRNDLGISQEELGFRAKLHRTYIGAIERAEKNLSVDNIEKIAKAFKVEPHRLLSDKWQ